MPDPTLHRLAEVPAQPVTRRAFLRGCGVALGAFATGAASQRPEDSKHGGGPRTFYLMPHSHIDVEWYWTFATTREWTADILNKAMALLRRDPEYRFTQDQVVLLKSYWEGLSAEDRAFFKQMVAEGRLAIVGGMLVQPEVAEPSGEALVRQILVGQQWLEATLGVRARCGWFIDTFGQIPQLPQILRQAGFDAYVFWRDIPLEYPIESLPADFYCESPDGTRILTHWLAGGYSFGDAQIRAAVEHSRTGQVLVPYGCDVSRPTADSPAIRRDVEARLGKLGIADGRLRVATALEYFEALRQAPGQLPVVRMDFNPPQRAQDLRGTYDNRIELKKRNRAAEQALYSAECLAAIASVAGHAYPQAALEDLWEKLLFTHFHDIIGGSHSDPVYLGAMERLEAVLAQTAPMSLSCPAADCSGCRRDRGMVHRLQHPVGAAQRAVPGALRCAAAATAICRAAARGAAAGGCGGAGQWPSVWSDSASAGSPRPEAAIEFIAEECPCHRLSRVSAGPGRRPASCLAPAARRELPGE